MILVAPATLFTAGTTRVVLACCEWGNPVPLALSMEWGAAAAVQPWRQYPYLAAGLWWLRWLRRALATYAQPAVGWGGGCRPQWLWWCGGYATHGH